MHISTGDLMRGEMAKVTDFEEVTSFNRELKKVKESRKL